MFLPIGVALASLLQSAAAPTAKEPEPGPWEGSSLTLGLDWLTGNIRSLTVDGEGLAEYHSPRWILDLEVEAVHERSAPPGEAQREVANSVSGWARGERRFTPLLSGFLYVGSGESRFASVELLLEAEAGVGFSVLDHRPGARDELVLRLYVGAHYTRELRYQYYPVRMDVPDQDVWSPGLAMTFRAGLNPYVKLSEYAFLFPAPTRTLVRSKTRLSSSLVGHLALAADFTVSSNTVPAPGKARTDTELTLGLLVEL